jgi:hypothetical protein
MSITLSSLVNPTQQTAGTVVSLNGTSAGGFTGIPSTAKNIQIIIQGVSLTSTDDIWIQVGNGSYVTTGYLSRGTAPQTSNVVQTVTSTSAFAFLNGSGANTFNGVINIVNITGNNWVCSGNISSTNGSTNVASQLTCGSIALGGTLDRVRITVSGTNTFDAGSVNIIYQ